MANKKYKWFLTKRNRAMSKNNPVAKKLYTPQYKSKVVESKKVYDRKDDKDFYNHMKEEQEILDIGMKESLRQKEERTK
mgnify:FL=1|jgi:hypothetical protein